MRYITARQVWHDCFRDDVTAMDIGKLNVQYTVKGADNKIIDHVEKAFAQHVINNMKKSDPVAWAWGMFAYAPIGVAQAFERAILIEWIRKRFRSDQASKAKPFDIDKNVMMLARIAMSDAAREDVCGARVKRKYDEIGALLGISGDVYKEQYLPHFKYFKDLCRDLPARALPHLSSLVMSYEAMADGGEDCHAGFLRCVNQYQ